MTSSDDGAPEDRPAAVAPTSDETRVRPMLLGAAVAAAAAIASRSLVGPDARAGSALAAPRRARGARVRARATAGGRGEDLVRGAATGRTLRRAPGIARARGARGARLRVVPLGARRRRGDVRGGPALRPLGARRGNVAGTASLEGPAGATVPLVRRRARARVPRARRSARSARAVRPARGRAWSPASTSTSARGAVGSLRRVGGGARRSRRATASVARGVALRRRSGGRAPRSGSAPRSRSPPSRVGARARAARACAARRRRACASR